MASPSSYLFNEYSAAKVKVVNLEKDVYNMTGTFNKTTVFSLKSHSGLNLFRNNVLTSGTGSIVNNINDPEYHLTTQTTGDTCILESKNKCPYIPGKCTETGVGLRIETFLTGTQEVKWGVFDGTNGYYFKKNRTGFYACVMNNGIEYATKSTEFNRDRINGKGVEINFEHGNIFIITYTWYGYGPVEFMVVGPAVDGSSKNLALHVYQGTNTTSIRNPVLPLRVSISGDTPVSVYVAGRQCSVLGTCEHNSRNIGENVLNKNITSDLTSILNLRNITTYQGQLQNINIKTTKDALIEIRINTTLSSTNFNTKENYYSVMQSDTTSNVVTDGIILWSNIVESGKCAFFDLTNTIYKFDNISVCVKSLDGPGVVNYLHLNWSENW